MKRKYIKSICRREKYHTCFAKAGRARVGAILTTLLLNVERRLNYMLGTHRTPDMRVVSVCYSHAFAAPEGADRLTEPFDDVL